MAKKWKLNIINGTVHTGLSEILNNSYACGKRQIFTKDFAKEWVGYAISLVSITIAKESLLGFAIAKLSVNGTLSFIYIERKRIFVPNVNINLDTLWSHLEAMSISLLLQYKWTLKGLFTLRESECEHWIGFSMNPSISDVAFTLM